LYRTYATPLLLDIQSSRQLFLLLIIISSLVIVSLLLASFAFYFKVLFLLLFSFFSFLSCRNINNERRIIWNENNEWEIIEAGVSQNANLLPTSFISQWLSIFNFKLHDNKKKTVLVFADAVHEESFRKLRVRLKVDGI